MRERTGGDEVEAVERFAQRRWLMVLLFTLAFTAYAVSWMLQLSDVAGNGAGSPSPRARAVGAGFVWAAWGLAVLAATFGGGGPRWSARQRRVLNDELAAANRRTAAGVGYGLLLAGLTGLCGAVAVGATPGALLRVAVPVLATSGVAVPALVFSALQRRAGPDTVPPDTGARG